MAGEIRVLFVDDEPSLLEMGKSFLEQNGEFAIDTLVSAPEALKILNKKNFDAIVSDYQMPGMTGIEFLKRVRSTDTTIPFIIFTGRGREEIVIEALNNGADFYLQKGGDPDTLYTELMHVIRKSVRMKQTQATLAEQEQRYHDIQNANDLIQSVEPDGHFLFVNKKWLDTLGYQERELPNLTIFDVIHEESFKHCMETFHRVISGENVGIIDAVFRTRDGKRVYVEGMASCRMVEGKPQFTRGIFKDVTDRKLAEAALKESEARYRNVVEDQTEFISRFRPDGTHVFANEAYCRYYNKSREEIIGKRFVNDIPTEDRVPVRQHFASLTQKHPVATITHRITMPGGRIRWQQWSNRAIFDDDGHLLEYQSVGRDITDLKDAEHELLRKNEEINAAFEELTATEEELRQNYDLLSQKERALRESEEKFRTLVEHSLDGILIVDFMGTLLFANQAAGRIVEAADYLGMIGKKNVLEFVATESRAEVLKDFSQVMQGIDAYLVHYKLITEAKREIWVECIGKKITFKETAAMLVSLRDITERKRIEDALREREQQLTSFMQNLPVGIFRNTPGPSGRRIMANPVHVTMHGYDSVEELMQHPVSDMYADPDDRKMISDRLLREGRLSDVEIRLKKKSGELFWARLSAIAVPGPDGEVAYFDGVLEDITDRKKKESAFQALVRSMVGTTGFDSFRKITENISSWLGAECVMIGEIQPDRQTVKVLSMLLDGKDIFDFSYTLKGTPCGNVAEKGFCLYPDNVIQLFPGSKDLVELNIRGYIGTPLRNAGGQVIGILCVLSRSPVQSTPAIREIMDIIAVKAAAEIERTQMERALRENEKKFRTIFENSLYPISINSIPDGKFIAVNAAFLQSSGYAEGEVLGKSPVEMGLLSLMDFGRLTSHLLLSGRLENVPMVLVGKGGIQVHVQFSTIPVTINDRPAIMTMAAEITKLKRVEEELQRKNEDLSAAFEELTASEEELRQNYDQLAAFQKTIQESEARFRTLFAISPEGIILFDIAGRITFASPEAMRMFRVSSMDEAVGTSVFDWVDPEYHERVREAMVELLDGEFRCETTYRVRRRDGSSFFGETSQGIFPDANGHPDGYMVIIRDITDRLQAEMALRESEEQYRSLAEQVHDGIYIYQGTRFVFVNSLISRITGYSKDELLTMDFIDLVHPDDRAYVQDLTERRRRGEQVPDIYDIRIVQKDGSVRYAELAVSIILFRGGYAVLGAARDITERKIAEEALRESEEKLALVMNGVPTLLAYLDSEMRFVYMNKAHMEWYGRTEEELIGKSLKELLPEGVFLRALPYYQQVLSGREVIFENPSRDREGQERVLIVRLVPHVHGEQVIGFFAALDDITEHKRMEAALRESEENFHAMFESHDSIMLLIEPVTGKIIDANLAAERFYGRSRKELCTQSIDDINALPPETVAAERAKAARGQVTFFTFPHRIANGEIRTVEVHSTPIAMGGKTILFSIIHDITERKQAEEALRQANKKLSLLSGITRHDINNQLLSLNGFLELLHAEIPDPAYKNYFTQIMKASSRIATMIKFTKEYEQIGLHAPVWQDLQTLVNSAGKDAMHGQVKLKNDLPAGTEVFADPLIVKVFFNLIDNAVRHGEKITTIRFSFKAHDGDRIIVCEDDGAGVVTEEKEKIFKRGFGKNTGFGLALSREILDITGITIKETGKPGVGARFEIRVPKNMWRSAEAGGKVE